MKATRLRNTALLVTGAVLLLAGCSGAGGSTSASALEKTTATVAAVLALDSAGFFIALHQGLFKAQGLTVKFTPATSSETAIARQVTGQYDITAGNYVSYIQAQQAGEANLDIFAEGSVMEAGAQTLFTMPDSPIKTLAELKSKTIGINAPTNIPYLLAASVLAEHGIAPMEVKFVTSYSFPQMPGELKAGVINAAVMPEPFASVAEQQDGAVPLADLNQGATSSFPVEGYVVTKQWAQRYPNTLAAFYRALEQGQQIADNDRAAVESAMEALPKPLAVSAQTTGLMALDEYPVSTGGVGDVDQISLQQVVDVMQQFIGFDPSFKINTMLMSGR
jgi:NitT/TauT family transport system substrate-binding protein